MATNAYYLLSTYRVTELVLLETSSSLFDLSTVLNASPKIRTVVFYSLSDKFTTYLFESKTLPTIEGKPSDPNVRFNHVTTVGVESDKLSLLCMFPNAQRVSLIGTISDWAENFTSSAPIKEVEVEIDSSEPLNIVAELKLSFPDLTTIYMNADNGLEPNVCDQLERIGREFKVKVYCRNPHQSKERFDLSATSYHGYFNAYGETPFDKLKDSNAHDKLKQLFEKMPNLTLEYNNSFQYRYPQFTFPFLSPWQLGTGNKQKRESKYWNWSNCDETTLQICVEHNMLPPWICVRYYLQLSQAEKAIQTLKAASMQDLEFSTCGEYPIIFAKALDQIPLALLEELGIEKLNALLENDTVLDYLRDKPALLEILRKSNAVEEITKNNTPLNTVPQITTIFKRFKAHNFDEVVEMAKQCDIQLKDLRNEKGQTLLTYAITSGYYVMIQAALRYGLDVNKPDNNGKTALIVAIESKYQAAVEILLQNGADPNIADNSMLPLHLTLSLLPESEDENVIRKLLQIMSILLTFGADVNKCDFDKSGQTAYPLTLAIALGIPHDFVRNLILRGADPTVTDKAGNTLLHLIFDKVDLFDQLKAMIGLLVKYIDVNKPNMLGRTPLHNAISILGGDGAGEIVKLLVKYGANVNQPDLLGRTPLMFCFIACADVNIFSALLETNQIDIQARTKFGQSFLSFTAPYFLPNQLQKIMDGQLQSMLNKY